MPVKPTSHRDRTLEFHNLADRLKKSSSSSASNGPSSSGAGAYDAAFTSTPPQPSRSAAPIQSEFNRRASRIALGIHQTSQKLSKLAKLAKRTSVFDDPTVEIQELTAVIKQDITALNSAVVDLQLLSNSQNDGGLSTDSAAHSTTVVDNLKNNLMSTTKEFKEVLTMRTENLKVHENRRQLFSSSASKESSNPFVRQRNPMRNCWSSKYSLNYYENYDYLSQIMTNSDSISGEPMSRMSEEGSLFSEMKTTEEAISTCETFDTSSSSHKDSVNTQSTSDKETLRSIDPIFPSGGGEKRKKRMISKVVYPFAVVKPGGIEGDVTLNDINERILMPPTRPVKHPVGDFACQPIISPDGPGLSGKAVVALTRIHTQGRGTITIIRTRG